MKSIETERTKFQQLDEIMTFLGRKRDGGRIRESHLYKILEYFQKNEKEEMKKTLGKLALVVGMSQRNLRENYIEGLEYFGFIDVFREEGRRMWEWRGLNHD